LRGSSPDQPGKINSSLGRAKMSAQITPKLKTDIRIGVVAEIFITVVVKRASGKSVAAAVAGARASRHHRFVLGVLLLLGGVGRRGGGNHRETGDESYQLCF
jgi:hypothetical protein